MDNKVLTTSLEIIACVSVFCYGILVVNYYIKKIMQINRLKNLINEIQREYDIEINNLFRQYEYNEIELDEVAEKQEFLTSLYIKFYMDLETNFIQQNEKRKVRTR